MARNRPALVFLFPASLLASAGVLAGVACNSNSSGSSGLAADGGAPGFDGGVFSQDASSSSGFDGSLLSTIDATPGGACDATADCPPGLLCLYPVAPACGATPVCEVLPAAQCAGPYCTCRGDTTAACGGYAELPMQFPLHGPPCGAAGDDGGSDAGAAHD